MGIAAGTQIDAYEIIGQLGQGGMGEVYLALDRHLGRKVAIKFLPEEFAHDATAKSRLVREAKAAAKLEHRNICSTYAFGDNNGRSYIVFQYIDGEDLAQRIGNRPINISEALSIATQIGEALSAAHSHNIIHRDIKPANVMISNSGEVKVLDFGLAKILYDAKSVDTEANTNNMLSTPGVIMGTVAYMSPEQTRGDPLDQRSDIFSFGVVLYEMITGVRPFEARSMAEIISAILTLEPPLLKDPPDDISLRLLRSLTKCLEKSSGQRYQSMAAVLVDLDEIKREYDSGELGQAVVDSRETPTVLLEPSESRSVNRPRFLISGLVLAAIVGLGYYGYTRQLFSFSSSQTAAKLVNPVANDLYLRGKVKIGSENKENTDAGIALLEQAVAADPNFVVGYAELARAYNVKAIYFADGSARKVLNDNAEFAVAKALSIDPNLPEGHFSRALTLWTHENHFPHELTIRSYKRAIELNPNFDEARHQLASVYFHIGLTEKAREQLNAALTINPANKMARFRLGTVDSYEGKFEEALIKFKAVPHEANRALIDRATADVLLRFGRIDEAEKIVDEYLKDIPNDEGGAMTSVKAVIFAKRGQLRESEDAIRRATELGRGFGHFHHATYNFVAAYAIMNRPDNAVKWLQETTDDGFPCYPLFNIDPNLDNLRNNEGFIAFMLKLKEQWGRFNATL